MRSIMAKMIAVISIWCWINAISTSVVLIWDIHYDDPASLFFWISSLFILPFLALLLPFSSILSRDAAVISSVPVAVFLGSLTLWWAARSWVRQHERAG